MTRVTILLSDDIPAYTDIKDELTASLAETPITINLKGGELSTGEALSMLGRTDNQHIVAIGQLAAEAAKLYGRARVVFCQVFNHFHLGLTGPDIRGVSMTPPVGLQFEAWKELDPGLRRAGVITGPGHKLFIDEARRAAKTLGFDLVHREVQSDKEMLYEFKRLTPEIQGLWLVPDERVLSRRVMRDLMAYSAKHRRYVVVFHPNLLELGGLMSVRSVATDVAAQVIAALKISPRSTNTSAKTLLPLTEIEIDINLKLAREIESRAPLASRVKAYGQ